MAFSKMTKAVFFFLSLGLALSVLLSSMAFTQVSAEVEPADSSTPIIAPPVEDIKEKLKAQFCTVKKFQDAKNNDEYLLPLTFSIVVIVVGSLIFLLGALLIRIVVGVAGLFAGFMISVMITSIIVVVKNPDNDNELNYSLTIWISAGSGLLCFLAGVIFPKQFFFLVGLVCGFFSMLIVDVNVELSGAIHSYKWLMYAGSAVILAIISVFLRKPFSCIIPASLGGFIVFFGCDAILDLGIAYRVIRILLCSQDEILDTTVTNEMVAYYKDNGTNRWIGFSVVCALVIARASLDFFLLLSHKQKRKRQH